MVVTVGGELGHKDSEHFIAVDSVEHVLSDIKAVITRNGI